MTIGVLADRGQNHCQITGTLGVTEGAVRYQLRRLAEARAKGRSDKPGQAKIIVGMIAAWM